MSWFQNLSESATISQLEGYIKNCSDILGSTGQGTQISDIKNISNVLLYTICGYSPGTKTSVINTRYSQEVWYNSWTAYNTFNTDILLLIVDVENKQTAALENFYDNLNKIIEFIITRYFANEIPVSYWKGQGDPKKPIIADPSSELFTPMLNSLYNFFYNGSTGMKGLGNNIFTDMCKGYTRTTISENPNIRKWCGCFGPDDPIAIQAAKKYTNSASYTKACDPICIYPQSIKLADPTKNYDLKTCNSQICILSKASIDISGGSGTVNFQQNCPCSTENSPCFCIIDSTIEDLLNKTTSPDGGSMAVSVTFKQYCPGARCMVLDEKTQELIEIDCQNDDPNNTQAYYSETNKDGGKTVNIEIFFVIGIIATFVILFILCARHIEFEPIVKINNVIKQSKNITKYTTTSQIGYLNR